MAAFHFLRPWWFLASIPAITLFILALRHSKSEDNLWNKYCDPHLLKHLLYSNDNLSKNYIPHLLLGLWLIAITALAGPSWSLYAENVYQKHTAKVIALDVSQSMNTRDIAPSRLERGKYKVLDILHKTTEGQTGMIVFSSAAFVVSPLTSDSNTIASMVPVIDSTIVPVQGSDILVALNKSADLIKQAGFTQGQIILVTDSKPSDKAFSAVAKLARDGISTSILAIGTKTGGPVTNADGSFANDSNGNIIMSSIDSQALEQLAKDGNGEYITFTNDDSDVIQLLTENNYNAQNPSKTTATKSLWRDEGHWLIWLLIMITAFTARRGWLDRLC